MYVKCDCFLSIINVYQVDIQLYMKLMKHYGIFEEEILVESFMYLAMSHIDL